MKLIAQYSYQGDFSLRPLTNITFWAGAGFSKAWEPTSPVGSQLFSIDGGSLGVLSLLSTLTDTFGSDGELTYEQFRQLIYQLDMYERYPDLRSRYFDEQNIAMSRSVLRTAVITRFKTLSKISYFDSRLQKFLLPTPSKEQENILSFFQYLQSRSSGSDIVTEGLRTQFITTNYDYVIETILDNIIPDDEDSLFLYSYRGVTPSRIGSSINPAPLHDHWLANHLLKINGGFEILRKEHGYIFDYSDRPADDIRDNPPLLMLPSREQNYTDPYFQTIFPKAIRLMRESNILVLVGYSLPPDDALIRFILRQFAEEREDGYGKYVFYIDPTKNADKLRRLSEVFPWAEDQRFPEVFLYEGGLAEFAEECLAYIP